MKLTSWGRFPKIETDGASFETPDQLKHQIEKGGDLIAHGKGRSYGDSALSSRVVFSGRFNKILHFCINNC